MGYILFEIEQIFISQEALFVKQWSYLLITMLSLPIVTGLLLLLVYLPEIVAHFDDIIRRTTSKKITLLIPDHTCNTECTFRARRARTYREHETRCLCQKGIKSLALLPKKN